MLHVSLTPCCNVSKQNQEHGGRPTDHADGAVLEFDIPEAKDDDVDDVELTENDASGKITTVVCDPSSVLLYSF